MSHASPMPDGGGNLTFAQESQRETPTPQGRTPSVSIFYIHVSSSEDSALKASLFLDTYDRHPAGFPHDLFLVSNGGAPHPVIGDRFRALGARVLSRSNDGWDIGAYLEMARTLGAFRDLMVCLGESVHFHKRGWLERIAQAWMSYGPGMYGALASYMVRPHLNTSAFACSPEFMQNYETVSSRLDRYNFEHGPRALWIRIAQAGHPVKLVTWDGEYDSADWRRPANVLWKGDQSNCLVFCNHTDRYDGSSHPTQDMWRRGADGLGFSKRGPRPGTLVRVG